MVVSRRADVQSKMADPRTMLVGRFAFTGLLKTTQGGERWLAVEQESGRRVVLAVVEPRKLALLDSARGVKHRHLAGVLEVVRDVEPASLASGQALPQGFGVAIAEFVPGTTLHQELLAGAMNPAKAVAWLLRLADAVQALHSAGAIHQRVSPRSVIAVPEGRAIPPVLSQLVAPALGPFCPPERLRGSPESMLDDVWALHATLYAALTGQNPYRAPSRDALLKQMLSGRPKPLAGFGIQEPALQEILDRGLAYERRVRVTELAELVATLDAWERDPRHMPSKRQVAPRPVSRSSTDLMGASVTLEQGDWLVIDGTTLANDEGAELNPAARAPSSPGGRSVPVMPALARPAPPPLDGSAFLPLPMADPSPLPPPVVQSLGASFVEFTPGPSAIPAARIVKRLSINPFERKRSVWPLVLLAAGAGGGGVYVAVAPAGAPSVVAQQAAVLPTLPPKQAKPSRPKQSPEQLRDASRLLVLRAGHFCCGAELRVFMRRGGLPRLRERARAFGGSSGQRRGGAREGGFASATAGRGRTRLVVGLVRASRSSHHPQVVLRGSRPVSLPETSGWCEQLQTAVRRIADDSAKSRDLAPEARSFERAVSCLFANKLNRFYAYDKPPTEAYRQAFQHFLSRAAISEEDL